MNLANLITLARIAIAPIYLWLLLEYYEPGQIVGWYLLAGFILVAATDGIDGAIARRQNKVTKLGKLLDPIADKILLGGAFVILSMLNVMPWWATIAILIREIGITIYRLIVIRDQVIPASSGGKSKTIMQSIALGWVISPLDLWWFNPVFNIGYGLIYGAVFLTWWSAIQYIRDSR
ncbi:MAG: CDP-diacylglycerol--glycerol-3-phosphate 3-phosphatidyltransferase [Rhodoluna sp.]